MIRTLRLALLPGLLALAASLAACGSPTAEASGPAGPRPHVILISIDTLRQDHVGCYGYERDTTPNLDALAAESVLFERAYTTMSWTLIAHMSMLTGLYPSQHQVWKEQARLSPTVPTMAERLRQAGYHTLGFYDSTAHWVDPEFGYDRGFELYQGHVDAEEASAHLRAALDERPKRKPLFVFVHLFDVHNAPLKKIGDPMYDPPPPFDDCFVAGARERTRDADTKKWWYDDAREATPEQHEAIVALYDSGVRYVDDRIGRWLEEWKREGIYDDALIVVTSDHGEGLRQREPKYGGHGDAREEGLRVPLIVKLPGSRDAGTRVSGAVSHVDLLPTVLDELDLADDERLPGYSLLAGRPASSILYAERGTTQVLIQWPYKLIQSSERKEIGALYDLEKDPLERGALRARSPKRAQFDAIAGPLREQSEKERERWFRADAEVHGRAIDAAARANLDALGYGGGDDDEDGEQDGGSPSDARSSSGVGEGD